MKSVIVKESKCLRLNQEMGKKKVYEFFLIISERAEKT